MPIPLRSIFAVNDCAIDLLEKLLTFEPYKRLSASQAIAYRYLDVYRDPDDEPDCPPPESSYLEFDLDATHEEADLKELLYLGYRAVALPCRNSCLCSCFV
ncbi:hypothetical protein B0H14DRAFT_2740243 [Mycena olivaceomarginata]|nr:hypothetical protein B0H14DRAFT_1212348 [Mycena olivaceomarginata]KAJ7862510.1 hypothetical protein B0H14DRAFT_2740243 [Mycena olivaceomarginata]